MKTEQLNKETNIEELTKMTSIYEEDIGKEFAVYADNAPTYFGTLTMVTNEHLVFEDQVGRKAYFPNPMPHDMKEVRK